MNAAPRVLSRRVSSKPVAPNYYGPGEKIQFTIEFSLPVTVVGDPELEIAVTLPAPQNEFASYLSGSGSGATTLVFSYTVLAADADADSDGIDLFRDPLTYDTGESIVGVVNGLEAVNEVSGPERKLPDHKVDGAITN